MKTEGHDLYHITDEFAGKRAMMHNQSLKTENVNANIESLRRIIAILKEKNIELQIVVPPVMKNYYLNLDTKWLAKNDSIITVLNREYNLRIIDFGKEDHGFNECIDCFNDADHLNMVGAEKFSRMMR